MLREPRLAVIYVVESGTELVVALPISRKVLDNDVLQLAQLHIRLAVVLGKGVNVVVVARLALQERVDVWEDCLLFVLHVVAYAMGVLVVQLHNEGGHVVRRVERSGQFLTDKGQLKI